MLCSVVCPESIHLGEEADNSFCRLAKLLERKDSWISAERPDAVKRYMDSNLNLVVRIGRFSRQSVAFLKRLASDDGIKVIGQRANSVNPDSIGRSVRIDQLPVLPFNVHVMEHPKHIVSFPSVVKLETFDHSLIGSGKPLYLFTPRASVPLSGRPVEFSDGVAHRKVDILFPDVAVSLGEPIGEEIQGASHGINDRPNLGVNNPGQRIDFGQLPSLLAGLSIFVEEGGAWASVDPCLNPFSEHIELGFGPINACHTV
jgi:hypothetical protein